MKVKPFFRWYDLWIGLYIDREARAVYICPIPCFGICLTLSARARGRVD